MTRLGSRELRKLLDFIHDCYALRPHSTFPDYLVAALHKIVPGDIHAYNEICTERKIAIAKWAPSSVQMIPDGLSILAKHAVENPVVPYFEKTRDGRPKKVTDFIPLGKFQRCALHNEFYLPFRIRYHLSTALTAGGKTIITLTSHRWNKDFSDSERTILDLVRPHVVQALTNSRLHSAVRQEAESRQHGLEALAKPLLAVNGNGKIRWMTEAARPLSVRYGVVNANRQECLADHVRSWLTQTGSGAEDDIALSRMPLTIPGAEGSLAVRVLSRNPELLLLLDERRSKLDMEAHRSLGLTPRRTEILGWVARGKSNPEIADILGISVRTVHKHVERIYQDLGVDHRYAAMARVLDVPEHAI